MRKPDYDRRVVVTGLGVISPVGNDVETAWGNLIRGQSGLRVLTKFDVARYEAKAAGEVRDFDAVQWLDPNTVRRSDPRCGSGVAAGKQALQDSGFEITDANREEVGIVTARAAGGHDRRLISLRPPDVQPTFIANAPVDWTSGMLAIETGAIGHNVCIAACATAPIPRPRRRGHPARRLHQDLRSSGGARLETAHAGSPTYAGWGCPGEPMETVSRRSTRPATASPARRRGCLQDLEIAKARGARRRRVVGYGSAADGWDTIQPIANGTGSAGR